MHRFIPQELYYRLNWRAHGMSAAAHQTRNRGTGLDFCGYAPFLDYPNPRRLDLRASIRSIPRQYVVRSYYERGAVNVYALADLSSSMAYQANTNKQSIIANISASVAWSANLTGDSFGLIACDDAIRTDLQVYPSRQRATAQEVFSKLSSAKLLQKRGATALPKAVEQLSHHRSLVFLISDFHIEVDLLKRTLGSLSQHDVVPIVLWDTAEYDDLPRWGWARVRDMESGQERSLFFRGKVVDAIKDEYVQRQLKLKALCSQFGFRPPYFVGDTFSAESLTRHLLEQG